jgi:hypothetical protein
MAQRVFFLNRLREGVDRGDYEDWIRRADYPVARRQPSIESYVVTRLDGTLGNEAEPPYQYLEVLEVTDINDYRTGLDSEDMKNLLAEWQTYVAESVAVFGEVIEG